LIEQDDQREQTTGGACPVLEIAGAGELVEVLEALADRPIERRVFLPPLRAHRKRVAAGRTEPELEDLLLRSCRHLNTSHGWVVERASVGSRETLGYNRAQEP